MLGGGGGGGRSYPVTVKVSHPREGEIILRVTSCWCLVGRLAFHPVGSNIVVKRLFDNNVGWAA